MEEQSEDTITKRQRKHKRKRKAHDSNSPDAETIKTKKSRRKTTKSHSRRKTINYRHKSIKSRRKTINSPESNESIEMIPKSDDENIDHSIVPRHEKRTIPENLSEQNSEVKVRSKKKRKRRRTHKIESTSGTIMAQESRNSTIPTSPPPVLSSPPPTPPLPILLPPTESTTLATNIFAPIVEGFMNLASTTSPNEQILFLTYAEDLQRSLQLLWWPLKLAMRVPFQVTKKKKVIKISVDRRSPWFYSACIMTGFLWIVWLWLTIGLIYLYYQGDTYTQPTEENGCTTHKYYKISKIEKELLKRYISNLFIIWSALSHASIASLHLLYTCEDHAALLRDWYHAVDMSKIKPTKGLSTYIVIHLVIILVSGGILWLAYYYDKIFPGVYGSTKLMSLAFFRIFLTEEYILENSEYYKAFAPVGMCVYIFAVVSSRLNLLLFLVISRVFRESSHLLNRRIEIALGQRRSELEGQNAVHLDYLNIYKDHLQISTLGKQIGNVFGQTVVSYYAIQMLCITLELSSIAYFEFNNPQDKHISAIDTFLEPDEPIYVITNSVCNLTISLFSFLYISYEGARAGEMAMEAFDIIRRQGLILAINERERNFVRSMWYSGSSKYPLLIRPGNMFNLTRTLIVDVLGTVLFYFVLMWQFRYNQIQNDEKKLRLTGRGLPTHPLINEKHCRANGSFY